tara:strand:+ start:132 stop:311 length:180 start_codon:yes stop_codon:yes gene_type:complete
MDLEESDKLSEGLYEAISGLLYREAMYTELDLEDKDTIKIIADVLRKIADDIHLMGIGE